MTWTHVTIPGDVLRAPRRRVADSGTVVATLRVEVVSRIDDGSDTDDRTTRQRFADAASETGDSLLVSGDSQVAMDTFGKVEA